MNENITQAEKNTFVEFWSKQKMAIAGKVSENTMK